jgi:cellulose synthase/poly-beta-1,6-N-acetylglucosamine synthase-like glycosyltransferase
MEVFKISPPPRNARWLYGLLLLLLFLASSVEMFLIVSRATLIQIQWLGFAMAFAMVAVAAIRIARSQLPATNQRAGAAAMLGVITLIVGISGLCLPSQLHSTVASLGMAGCGLAWLVVAFAVWRKAERLARETA